MFIKQQVLDAINEKLNKLEVEQEKLNDTIHFLLKYNKDDIIANTIVCNVDEVDYSYSDFMYEHLSIKYISSYGTLQKIPTTLRRTMAIKDIEKVSDDICVLHFQDTNKDEDWKCPDTFLQLNKRKNEIMDITEIKARYENQEKVSENLKDSAQALGEAFKGIFGSCTKNECKCKKSSADKTKKQETAPKTKSRKNTKKEEK